MIPDGDNKMDLSVLLGRAVNLSADLVSIYTHIFIEWIVRERALIFARFQGCK